MESSIDESELKGGRDLDSIDHAILAALQSDGRLSNKELAAAVGLAPSSCLGRVRRLRQEAVILGFHADVSSEALGIGLQAMMSVRLERHRRDVVNAFRAHAWKQSEVIAVYHVGGAHDFLLHVAVRDSHHLRDLAMDAFTTRDEVAQIETHLIFEHRRKFQLPQYGS